MFEKPIVAFDGSEPSRRALRAAVELAARFERPLRVLTVIEGIPDYVNASAYGTADAAVVAQVEARRDAEIEALFNEARRLAAERGAELIEEALAGDEVDCIVDAVFQNGCDLLIVGLRHHPGLLERLTSRTAQTLMERVPCSVLGVR